MFKIVEVKALPEYRLWLRYADGVEGEVDLTHLVGKGVFLLWEKPRTFEQVRIGEYDQLVWSEEIELCADALYLCLTGQTPEQVFPALTAEMTYA